MIRHVYDRAVEAGISDTLIVATDDERIAEAARTFGADVRITSSSHRSGTDRVAEVARSLSADIIVNLQGDEPFIHPQSINAALTPLLDDPDIDMGTLRVPLRDPTSFEDPNVVKVITDRHGFALYFSRAPIPYRRHRREDAPHAVVMPERAFKHVGLYIYRRSFLLALTEMAPTPLETLEGLEQLRVLENGHRLYVAETEHDSLGIDTPEDLDRARAIPMMTGD